jgi:hypothetical protein
MHTSTPTKLGRDLRPGDGVVVLGDTRQIARIILLSHPRIPKGGGVAHFHACDPLVIDPDYPYETWG